jgi:hypothetical protein
MNMLDQYVFNQLGVNSPGGNLTGFLTNSSPG